MFVGPDIEKNILKFFVCPRLTKNGRLRSFAIRAKEARYVIVFEWLDQPFSQKMEVVTNFLTKPQYSHKHSSILFFVKH